MTFASRSFACAVGFAAFVLGSSAGAATPPGQLLNKTVDRCLQAHGGFGYSDEFPISRQWRDARLITIGGGTSEIMKEILSKRLGWG